MNLGTKNETLQFKESASNIDNYLFDIVTMLNMHQYGVIYLGAIDNGDLNGLLIETNTTREITNQIYQNINPIPLITIEILNHNNLEYIKVSFKGTEIPYTLKGAPYNKLGDETQELNKNQIQDENNSSGSCVFWEDSPSDRDITEVNEEILQRYIHQGYLMKRLENDFETVETSLVKLNLVRGKMLTNAGKFLFSNKGPIWLRMAVFSSEDKSSIIGSLQIRGNIFECINRSTEYILSNIKWTDEFKDSNEQEVSGIPLTALKEIIVNSFVYANYLDKTSFHEIDIFPNSILIYNPGRLIVGQDSTDFSKRNITSINRNPRIYDTTYQTVEIEIQDPAYINAFKELSKIGIKYEYNNTDQGFIFKIYRKGYSFQKQITRKELTKPEAGIMEIIREFPDANIEEISKQLFKSVKATYTNILKLEKYGYILRYGSVKKGHWRIIN